MTYKKILFLCLFLAPCSIMASNNSYEQYFKQQEEIYKKLENLGIPGARPLIANEILAESVVANSVQEVDEIISDFEKNLFSTHKKNVIFHGPSGTGKSMLAQAIAIKCKVPCLFFNVGTLSTEYMNSGVQNLSRIFKYAQELEKSLNKPCIIIFDELEALTKKHVSTNSSEGNILLNFWQELDRFSHNKIMAIGTMNNTEDVPEQITTRTSMIQIPLPNLKQADAILSYHMKKRQDKYKLSYPKWLTSSYLARKTKGFCNRDLENLVEQATRPVIKMATPSDGSNKIVEYHHFARFIKKTKQDFRKKWFNSFKKHLRDPKITIPLVGMTVMLGLGSTTVSIQRQNHKESMELQKANHKESLAVQKANQAENIAMQEKNMAQANEIALYQFGFDHMVKQAKINSIPWEKYAMNWTENNSEKEISISSEPLRFYGYSIGGGSVSFKKK